MTLFRLHVLFADDLPEWRAGVAEGAQRRIATRRLSQQLKHMPTPAFGGTPGSLVQMTVEQAGDASNFVAPLSVEVVLPSEHAPV